jgi:putative thioredoxin
MPAGMLTRFARGGFMASNTKWIVDVDESNVQQLVLEQSMQRPVIIDFWSERCAPCRQFGPILEKVVNEYKGAIVLAKVDVDQSQHLAAQFGIEVVPSLRVVHNGKLRFQHDGGLSEPQLRELFSQLGLPRVDPLLDKARGLEEKKPAEAEAIYRKLLEKDAGNEEARVGLARALVAQNKDEEVDTLLEAIDSDGPLAAEAQRIKSLMSLRGLSSNVSSDEAALRKQIESEPKNAQARYELGCLLAQKGKHEEALEMLLSAGERDMKLASTKIREAMVQIFYALGQSHPLSDSYRAKLARLLY